MAVACKIVLGAYTLYPMLPVGRTRQLIGVALPTASGKRRFAWRATKHGFSFVLTDASEAERTSWKAAFDACASATVTLTMEDGETYIVRGINFEDPLVRTTPAINDGLDTTGAGFYDLSLAAEQI